MVKAVLIAGSRIRLANLAKGVAGDVPCEGALLRAVSVF